MATSEDFSRSVVTPSDEVRVIYRRSVVTASHELRDIYCEPCVEDGKRNEAEGFCVDCSEYLCGPCYRNHTRYKAFKQHVLQDKDNMPLQVKKAYVKDVCVEKCSIHTTKVVEYFCKACDTLGCHACITINHRQCKNVDHIQSIVKDIEKSEELKKFIYGLQLNLKRVKRRKKTLYSNSNEIDAMKGTAQSMLRQQRDEIKKFFDQLEAGMNRRIENVDRENTDTLKSETSACDSVNDELETIKTDVETKRKNGQQCELFIAMKQAISKTDSIDNELEKLNKESKIQGYALAPSPQIKKVMENTSEFCKLHIVRFAKYLDDINVRPKSDDEIPWIYDLVIVQDQYLAITDNKNKSVKIVDTTSMSVQSEMILNCSDICSVTRMSDDKIALSIDCGNRKRIQIMSVSRQGSLSKGRLINIDDGECNGLAYSRENFFILQDEQVKVINQQGNIQNTIQTDFSDCFRCIAVNSDNETIYITNPKENTVKSMTLEGRVKAIYKDLKNPQSMTVGNDGMVYVYGSDSIHLLTEDLVMVQIIKVVDGGHITYSSTDRRLYVGRRDMIRVYEIG